MMLCETCLCNMCGFKCDIILSKGGQMLQLHRAGQQDAGQYVCTATNSAGQDQKSIVLTVYGQCSLIINVFCKFYFNFFQLTFWSLFLDLPTLVPLLDKESEVMTPQVGSSLVLRCEAHGIPEPEVTWYRNGLQLTAGNGLRIQRQQLEIVGVQVSKNALSNSVVHFSKCGPNYFKLVFL